MNVELPALLTLVTAPAIKAAVVLLAAGLATTLMRRSSASARHVVWAAAVAAALLMPAVSALVPVWRVAALPATAGTAQPPAGVAAPNLRAVGPALPTPEGGDAFAVPAPPATLLPLVRRALPPAQLPRILPSVGQPAESPVATAASQWRLAAVVVWAAGVTAVGVAWAVGVIAARRLVASAAAVGSGRLFDAMEDVRHELRIGRPVMLRVGGRASVPLTAGSVRPVVLLPEAAAGWSPSQLRP